MNRISALVLALCASISCAGLGLKLDTDPSVEQLKSAVEATVLVDCFKATGSGFVIKKYFDVEKNIFEYDVLTAAHVIASFISWDQTPILIHFNFDHNKTSKFLWEGEILKQDVETDLALLRMRSEEDINITPFKIFAGNEYLNHHQQVVMISYPEGLGPIITRGYITGINVLDWASDSYVTDAQSAPGSSGGTLIDPDTGYVVGMLRAVLLIRSRGQLLGWCSIITPAEKIRNFLSPPEIPVIVPGRDRGETPTSVPTPQDPIIMFYPEVKPIV